MARPPLKLVLPETAEELRQLYARERDPWAKNRLRALHLASCGSYSAAEVAAICGMARGHLFALIKTARTQGIPAVLQREKPGPKTGTYRGLSAAATSQFNAKRTNGDFHNARHAQSWLQEMHGLTKPYRTVWRWLRTSALND